MDLHGKTALITGGGTGIGRAIALTLAQKGMNIVINYSRSVEEAVSTLHEVESHGVQGLLCKADVSDEDEVREMVRLSIERFGRLDVLVNNAGTTNFVAFSDLDGLKGEFFDRAFAVNAKGMFFVSRACAQELKKTRGSIVNITSIAGLVAEGSSIAYCASKAAAISISKSLAKTLAPEVRVNAIAPGVVETRWVKGREDHVQRLGAGSPLGRVATPEDIAEVALSLVTTGFVTGQAIVVDGGKTI